MIDVFESTMREISDQRPTTAVGTARASRQRKRKVKLDVRSVFISDIHLGTVESKAREATDFLKHVRCEKLVLNGDIVDGWALRRGARWRKRHTKFIRAVLKMTEVGGHPGGVPAGKP